MQIATPRLTLHAATLEHLRAELEDPERLRSLLDAAVSPAWPPGEYDRAAMRYFHDQLERGGPDVEGWYGWYAVKNKDGEGPGKLVAAAGFLGPPDASGVVEIGYSVLPEWQRRGYAAEIVEALVEWACSHPGTQRVVAHTSPSNVGSAALLARCGFQQAGPGTNAGMIRFERAAPRRGPVSD